MTERKTGLLAVLSSPRVYRLLQRLVGAAESHPRFLREHVRACPGDRVLDLGCGPGHVLRLLHEVEYTGIDRDAGYIEAARRELGDRGTFHCADALDADVSPASFDIVIVMGLIHHLDDAAADQVFRLAAEALVNSGRLVVIEPTFVDGQHPIARWLIGRDRGASVRSPAGYRALAQARFGQVESVVRDDLLRVPYTHAVLECAQPVPGDRSA